MDFLTSKRFITTALVFLVVLNAGLLGVLWWQNTHGPFRDSLISSHELNRHLSFTAQLGLTEAQALSFRNLRQEHFRKVAPEMQAIAKLKTQLINESLNTKPDSKKIAILADSIGTNQAAIERELALHFKALAQACTPEQRNSLKKVLERFATRRFFGRDEHWEKNQRHGRGEYITPPAVGEPR
jgi:Spy/CpxP family protein refolding chaperone